MVKSKGGTIGTSPGGVDTVVTDVDPGEYDFSESRVQQPLHFFLDVFRRTTLQTGSDLGNDAIGTPQDTAVLDLDVGSLTTVKVADPLGQFHDAEAVQNVGKFPLVTNYFEHPGQFRHGLRVSSRVTTHHDRPRAGVPTGQLTDQLAAFRVTGRCDGAGVDDTDVG